MSSHKTYYFNRVGYSPFGEDWRLCLAKTSFRIGFRLNANPAHQGALALDSSITDKKEDTTDGCLLFWQRNRDSNPNIQSQSLLCYRYTIPLSLFSLIIVAQRNRFVKGFLKIIFFF